MTGSTAGGHTAEGAVAGTEAGTEASAEANPAAGAAARVGGPSWTIRRVTEVAEVLAAASLFDEPVRAEWAERFLTSPGHHLLVAYEQDGTPAGMVTGVEMTHPDKGTEMFLYELGVAEASRRRGIGRALVGALAGLARERGCYGMWVITEAGNAAALATYRAAGGREEADGPDEAAVVPIWTF